MTEANELLRLQDLIERCIPGEWGGDPGVSGVTCVVYRATDIDNDGRLNERGGVERGVLGPKIISKALVSGDILLEASGGSPDQPVGRVALFEGPTRRPALVSNFFRAIRPRQGVDPRFLTYQLVALNRSSAIGRYQQQTTGLTNLKVSDYLMHRLWAPDLAQQQRIAAILTSLDQAIEATEALIDKHQQIKAGLMHDLFTRGVSPSGKLRPSFAEAPALYRQEAGHWIPQEWQYEKLDALAVRGSGHTPNKNIPKYWNGGIKWVSLADSHRLDALYISDTELSISPQGIQNSSAVLHPAGIVVLSRDAGVGKSAITTEPMAVSQHFMCWKCDQQLDTHFLYYWLQFQKRTFENIAMGSTILTIGLPYFKKLRIACPVDLDEQRLIAERLKSSDENLFATQARLSKLKAQKLGLMQDLLTGKVRVPMSDPAAAEVN